MADNDSVVTFSVIPKDTIGVAVAKDRLEEFARFKWVDNLSILSKYLIGQLICETDSNSFIRLFGRENADKELVPIPSELQKWIREIRKDIPRQIIQM